MAPKKAISLIGIDELTNNKSGLGKALIAEAIGVFFINYFGCLSCFKHTVDDDAKSATLELAAQTILIALSFGVIIFVLVQTLAHVSGAHLNPAITIGLLVTGKVTVIRAILYIIAQCLGAIAGSAFIKLLVPGDYGATTIADKTTPVKALGLEFFLGFILIFVVCGVCDPNKPFIKINAALAIGLTVTIGHLTTVHFTGASMNPARTLGSSVAVGNWDNHWVYWIGPCLGGIVASLLYTFVLAAPQVGEYAPVNVEEKELKRLDSGKNEDGFP